MNEFLNKLVRSGTIKSYRVRTLDMDNRVVKQPGDGNRETDELTLYFPNGKKLTINTFCLGRLENTAFVIDGEIISA